jgi:hypothetical protein
MKKLLFVFYLFLTGIISFSQTNIGQIRLSPGGQVINFSPVPINPGGTYQITIPRNNIDLTGTIKVYASPQIANQTKPSKINADGTVTTEFTVKDEVAEGNAVITLENENGQTKELNNIITIVKPPKNLNEKPEHGDGEDKENKNQKSTSHWLLWIAIFAAGVIAGYIIKK